MVLMPGTELGARYIQIPQHAVQYIGTHGMSGMGVNTKRDAVPIAPPDLWRSESGTFLSKIGDEAAQLPIRDFRQRPH